MAWVRFPIWDEWRDLTRFWIASESALAAEHSRWSSLPLSSPETTTIIDPSRRTEFKCSLPDYVNALADHHRLYSMLLTAYTGLVEEHGRNLIEYLIAVKSMNRTEFPQLDPHDPPAEAAEAYIKKLNVETWGGALLQATGRTWGDVDCGKAGIVEAFTIRNITAHGLTVFNQTALNRIAGAGCVAPRWTVGQTVTLDRALFGDYIRDVRSFARALANAAAVAP